VDKQKFVEAVNEFIAEIYERERQLKDKIDPVDAPVNIKMMVQTAEMRNYSKFVGPHIGAIVMASGLDPAEFAEISKDQHKEKEAKYKKHAEWYRQQEFDV